MDLSVSAEFRGGALRTGLSGPQDCLQPWAQCKPPLSEDTWLLAEPCRGPQASVPGSFPLPTERLPPCLGQRVKLGTRRNFQPGALGWLQRRVRIPLSPYESGQLRMKDTPKKKRERERMSPKEEAQNLKTAFGLSGKGISEGGKLRQRAATSKEVASEKLL